MGMEININNNVEGKLGVGDPGYCNTSEGEFGLEGALTLYFNDETMYDKFLGNVPFSLSFDLADTNGNAYNIYLPKLKMMEDPINVEGKNTDVMENASYAALGDENIGCMIQITRFPAA